MVPIENLFARLQRSTFRSRFRLGVKERQYCYDKGAEVIDQHAADLSPGAWLRRKFLTMANRLRCADTRYSSPSTPPRPGCRGCLEKWHAIPRGRGLSEAEQRYVVQVIHHWLVIQMNSPDRGRA
ncbi:Uncharacterised protein [Klebsiella oxytoca]|nr:Uncharacterised protein [Klebsiella oxytoca]